MEGVNFVISIQRICVPAHVQRATLSPLHPLGETYELEGLPEHGHDVTDGTHHENLNVTGHVTNKCVLWLRVGWVRDLLDERFHERILVDVLWVSE